MGGNQTLPALSTSVREVPSYDIRLAAERDRPLDLSTSFEVRGGLQPVLSVASQQLLKLITGQRLWTFLYRSFTEFPDDVAIMEVPGRHCFSIVDFGEQCSKDTNLFRGPVPNGRAEIRPQAQSELSCRTFVHVPV